eukprot:COSAG02_NODE_665_length_18739_cov_9.192918_6_plen_225_part_00
MSATRQQADDAHDQLTTRFYYHERYGRGGLNQRIEDLRQANEGSYEPPSDPDGDSRLVEWNSTYGYPIGLQTSALRNPILRAALVRPEHQEAYDHTNGEYRRRHWQQRAQVGSERNRARALMRERQGDAATNLGLTVAQWGVRPSESGVDAFQGSAVQRELEGGAATLQSLLNKAYEPMKAPRRKAAPMSHRGASANQTSYALSGRPPPLPGMHEMSDGTIMND